MRFFEALSFWPLKAFKVTSNCWATWWGGSRE